MEKKYLNFVLEKIPKAASILDLGCGTDKPIAKFFLEMGSPLTGMALCQKQ